MLIPKLLLPNSQLFGSGSNNRHKIQTAIVLRVNSDLENHSGYFQEYLLGQNFKNLIHKIQVLQKKLSTNLHTYNHTHIIIVTWVKCGVVRHFMSRLTYFHEPKMSENKAREWNILLHLCILYTRYVYIFTANQACKVGSVNSLPNQKGLVTLPPVMVFFPRIPEECINVHFLRNI